VTLVSVVAAVIENDQFIKWLWGSIKCMEQSAWWRY